jgi:hypothetical protein
MKWAAFGAGVVVAVVIAAVALVAIGLVSAKIVAGVVQLLGIALTLLGVAVVRASLERAADTAIAAIARWAAQGREQLRRRGRPVTIAGSGTPTLASLSASGTGEVASGRVDRDAIPDRAWLAHLDDQVAGLWAHTRRAEENRAADRKELEECLAADHERLRGEIVRATHQGWELIVAGLAWSAVGTAVGIFG